MSDFTIELIKLCMLPFSWIDNIVCFVPTYALFFIFVMNVVRVFLLRRKVMMRS